MRWPVSPGYRLPAHPFLVEGAAAVIDTTVSMPLWRPETVPFGEPPPLSGYSGVGRKP